MHESKSINTPLGHHTKLSIILAPNSKEDKMKMNIISYINRVGSIIYRWNVAYQIQHMSLIRLASS